MHITCALLMQVGREEWLVNHTVVDWKPHETAIIIVDMWNVHWCHSATTRVGEIATPMNHTLTAALAMSVTVMYCDASLGTLLKLHTAWWCGGKLTAPPTTARPRGMPVSTSSSPRPT